MSIRCLISKVNGLVSETYRVKDKIKQRTQSKRRVDGFVKIRKDIRSDIRHHLLAYAFVCGNKYCKLESRCSMAPNVDKILLIVRANQDRSGWFSKVDKLTDADLRVQIINWINGV